MMNSLIGLVLHRCTTEMEESTSFLVLNRQKVRVKVEDKIHPRTAMKVQMRSTGIALLFINLGTRWEWLVNALP